jgi:hypothetical protein
LVKTARTPLVCRPFLFYRIERLSKTTSYVDDWHLMAGSTALRAVSPAVRSYSDIRTVHHSIGEHKTTAINVHSSEQRRTTSEMEDGPSAETMEQPTPVGVRFFSVGRKARMQATGRERGGRRESADDDIATVGIILLLDNPIPRPSPFTLLPSSRCPSQPHQITRAPIHSHLVLSLVPSGSRPALANVGRGCDATNAWAQAPIWATTGRYRLVPFSNTTAPGGATDNRVLIPTPLPSFACATNVISVAAYALKVIVERSVALQRLHANKQQLQTSKNLFQTTNRWQAVKTRRFETASKRSGATATLSRLQRVFIRYIISVSGNTLDQLPQRATLRRRAIAAVSSGTRGQVRSGPGLCRFCMAPSHCATAGGW